MVIAVGFAMYWFTPWKLFVDRSADDAFPAVVQSSAAPAPAEPALLVRGSFISHEHETSGTVLIYRLADGARVLRLEGLSTSDGPDVRVWLSDRPVIAGTDGWFVFADGARHDLGGLRANRGNLNYAVPADVDLAQFTSVSLWCRRFSVSFGAAELRAA